MPHEINIPFLAIRLKFATGGTILTPLFDSQAIRINESIELLEGHYAENFQRMILNKGKYVELMNELQSGDYYKAAIDVPFKASNDGISHPAFHIEFDYFFKAGINGYWSIVPALGIEAFSPELEMLEASVMETILLDFTRHRRLKHMQSVVSTLWYEQIELRSREMYLKIPSLGELNELSEGTQEALLPKIARALVVSRRITYGRKKELQQLSQAIKGRFNRNVLLVGASGVGKTALVWETARLMRFKKTVPAFWETTASAMIKELTGETGWQDQLAFLCQELAKSGEFLFVRNLMELFEVGQYVGNEVSMAEFMRPYISRGEVNILSECTEEELARIELRSPNYLSFFQIIRMEEPKEDLESIILQKVADLAHVRKLKIEADAIKETVRLNKRFTPYSGFPGKPIRFLESILMNRKPSKRKTEVNRGEVIEYFCEETGMPPFMVDPLIPMDPAAVKVAFNQQVFGQKNAVESVVNLLASVKTALSRTGKPIASLLFVGPTGVGKTELAKELAAFMFGSREKMVRFDMSEYADPYAVQRLTGEAFFKDGLLTAAVRREPFSVLLFDEIEKAYPSFYDLLLQMLSEGRLTDSKGQLVNFCSTIIIMTSNIGAGNLQNNRISLRKDIDVEAVTSHFMSAVQKHFRPELFNRIDEVIPFEPLTRETVRHVVDREIQLFRKREGIQFRPMDLNIQEAVYDQLAITGYDPKYGARQLQRSIRNSLIVPLAKKLNTIDYEEKLVVNIELDDKHIQVNTASDPLGLDLWLEELDKIILADQASELRRQVARIQEGHYFIALLSQLDLLQRDKKRLGKRFWENTQKANKYSYILQTQKDIEDLDSTIKKYELDLSLANMDLTTYNPALSEDIKDWSKQFFELKKNIYTHSNPDENYCFFAIYGKFFEPVLDLYLQLLAEMGAIVTGHTVWYREQHFNEEIIEVQTQIDKKGREIEAEVRRRRQEYIKKEFKLRDDSRLSPPKPNDVLWGIELSVIHPAIMLYLQEEEGLQRWLDADKKSANLRIVTSTQVEYTPTNIIRKEYYKGNPRRTYEPGFLKDTKFKISREVSKRQYLSFLQEAIQERFNIALDIALFGA